MRLGDGGVLLEFVVVAIGEIGAVVAAAAFFASEGGAGDERAEGVKIFEFVISSDRFCGWSGISMAGESFDGGFEFFAAAHDADVCCHISSRSFSESRGGGGFGFLAVSELPLALFQVLGAGLPGR